MEGIGSEVSEKIRSAIKAKLQELGLLVDEELPDYIMVMVANKKTKAQMDEDLQLFLGKHTSLFTTWLHQVLQKLQEVTVAKLGVKRKSSEETVKKKKSKQDSELKKVTKKIKEEPESRESSLKSKDSEKGRKNHTHDENLDQNKSQELDQMKKTEKPVSKTTVTEPSKGGKLNTTKKLKEEHVSGNENRQKESEERRGSRNKSQSVSSLVEDLEDEDCINIRTDGELLDGAEDMNLEEGTKKNKDNSLVKDKNELKDDKETSRHSPVNIKDNPKSADHNSSDRNNHKEVSKKQLSPRPKSPLKTDDKVLDARDLLNRRKAAKQLDARTRSRSRSRSRSRNRDRSLSPLHKRRDDQRESKNYREERNLHKRGREDDREFSSRKRSRNDDRDQRGIRDWESHSSKKRDDWPRKLESDKIDQKNSRRRESSHEPPSKRTIVDKQFKNRNDDWESSRAPKASEGRKLDAESPKRKDLEEGRKRGLISRVIPRAQEPEEAIGTPVPSVVKVTPRPRRPPSQQPSSTLIMKAISEANKSLANVPQRPDSTQRARNDAVYHRTSHHLKRIPPEKIAIEIINPLAHHSAEEILEEETESCSVSPIPKDKSGRNMSPPPDLINISMEVSPSEHAEDILEEETESCSVSPIPKDKSGRNMSPTSDVIDISMEGEPTEHEETLTSVEVENKTESIGEEEEEEQVEGVVQKEIETDEPQLEGTADVQAHGQSEEASEPQFVVTLNGLDPDNLYRDIDELDYEDWDRDKLEEEPILTSTPEQIESPKPNREAKPSPNVIVTPAVNHSNLIEVEILRTKHPDRCKYWPACRLGDKCTFYHPTKPCKMFPNCKFGDSCLYIHPQCKFNVLCTRQDCVFAHTPAHTPSQPAEKSSDGRIKFQVFADDINDTGSNKPKALYAASVPPCKYFPNCNNVHCQFAHLPRVCRFGRNCTKTNCIFEHGQTVSIDKFKWTRDSAT